MYEGNLTYSINSNQFNGQTLASISGGSAPNPNLQPFTAEEKEIGLEVRLFDNKLHFDLAAFDKTRIFKAFMQITGIVRSGILSYLNQILLS